MNIDQSDKLSEQEYGDAVRDLYSALAKRGGPVSEEEVRHAEFDLLIAHKLGKSFSAEIGNQLWIAQKNLQKKMARSVFDFLLRILSPARYAQRLQKITDEAVADFKCLLTTEELQELFDVKEGETNLILPIDPNRLK